MFAVKRSNPFGEDGAAALSPVKNVAPASAFESTLSKLMSASQASDEPMEGDVDGPCHVCLRRGSPAPCYYCLKPACASCLRECDACREVFCTFCSTSNYDLRHDRVFCLGCSPAAAPPGPAGAMVTD